MKFFTTILLSPRLILLGKVGCLYQLIDKVILNEKFPFGNKALKLNLVTFLKLFAIIGIL